MDIKEIKIMVDLIKAKVDILKLKADSYNWACHVDDKTKQKLEETLIEIDKYLGVK